MEYVWEEKAPSCHSDPPATQRYGGHAPAAPQGCHGSSNHFSEQVGTSVCSAGGEHVPGPAAGLGAHRPTMPSQVPHFGDLGSKSSQGSRGGWNQCLQAPHTKCLPWQLLFPWKMLTPCLSELSAAFLRAAVLLTAYFTPWTAAPSDAGGD